MAHADEPSSKTKTHIGARIGLGVAALLLTSCISPLAPWILPAGGCCGGLLAAVIVPLCDSKLIAKAWYSRRLALSRCILLAATAVVALGAGLLLGIGAERDAFRDVFGMWPPPTVRELSGSRSYAGMFDRDDICLRFVADKATLDTILAGGSFVRDDAAVQAYKDGDMVWTRFVDEGLVQPIGKPFGNWAPEQPMQAPVLYKAWYGDRPESYPANAAVLWDAGTGQTYVHRRGG